MVVLRSLSQFLLLLFCVPIVPTFGAALTYTNCIDILKLTPDQAKANHPARIRGVVTSFVPASQLCFVQDGTAGIYVFPSPWPKELSVGSVVDVEGVTGTGRFSPIIQWGRIQPTGQKANVQPVRISIEDLNTGRYDCQFVELEGVVQSAKGTGDAQDLLLRQGSSSAVVLLFEKASGYTNWIDARVRFRGVAGTLYSAEQLSGFGIFVSSATNVQIVKPATDAFSRPVRATSKLAWYSPEGALNHRTRVAGVVTLSWPGDSFFIQDQFGSVRIFAPEANSLPKPGDIVDVAGFLRGYTSNAPFLTGALWRKTGTGQVPPAELANLPDLPTRAPNGKLISIEGVVLSSQTTGSVSAILIEHGGRIIRSFSPGSFDVLNKGTTVRVNGAWGTPPAVFENDGGPGIWLQSTNSLAVIGVPQAATAAPNSRSRVGSAAAIGGIFVAVLLAWRGLVKSRRSESARLAATEQLSNLEKELAQIKEARERLGRDLHDHIIQSIYAVGLNIEDCRQMLGSDGKAEPRLGAALNQINGVIRELRNVILGLETNAIQPQEFRTALKSLSLALGAEKSNRMRLDIDQAAVELLSTTQATELIHIAREAMSNSVRHGDASTTTFILHDLPEELQFIVEDDGRGFDLESTDQRGYGLRNMAKRAEALKAKFTVQSHKGAGTRIVLDIPKQKQHFSNSESRSRINR